MEETFGKRKKKYNLLQIEFKGLRCNDVLLLSVIGNESYDVEKDTISFD